jgi:D-3-phosphoglycerate dehydrogenase
MKPLIWIIDECWSEYDIETKIFRERYPECTIKVSPYDYREDLETFGASADVILCQVFAAMPAETIRHLSKCKGIAVYGGGYELVDVAAARHRGICVANVPDYCKEDVADYVMAAVLHCSKQILSYSYPLQDGSWSMPTLRKRIRRVRGATLLVVGFGRIGRAVAAKARGLGMDVKAYDPYVDGDAMQSLGVEPVAWEEGLRLADFVSVHAGPARGKLGYEDFGRMKRTACLINTARGSLIVEQDLIRAVREGLIAGAVLDVVEVEPPTMDEEIFKCQGILVTPHIAYFSQESYTELKTRTVGNAVDMLEGREPADRVN